MKDEDKLLLVARELHITRQEYFDRMLEDVVALKKSYKKKAYCDGYMEGLETASTILWKTILDLEYEEGDEA